MFRYFASILLSASLAFSATAIGEPATQPASTQPASTAPAPGSYDAVNDAGKVIQKKYHALVPNNDLLADANADKRAAVAGEAVPLLKELVSDLEEMARIRPAYKWQIWAVEQQFQAALFAFSEPETVSKLNEQAKQEGREGLRAKRLILRGRWYQAGQDPAKQEPVLADVERLAQAQPGDMLLASLIDDIRSSATDPSVQQRMIAVLTDTMDNMEADGALSRMKAKNKVASFQGKPMVLAGKLPDGQDFTSADWKGKVVLVDFWAVWCAPCRAELPRVKKMYEQYHDKGLEVLGVDNDDPAKSLITCVTRENMPWPQLFDADAAAQQKWHPLTRNFGIDGIPVMFLIDKKGVCRSVTARDDFEKLIPQLLAE